ncbi:hypothetical protein A3E04_01775 [Candidatus Kuenenbacteria bacterium RIFCSPHIGHO2_12_FULL_42_14]|uniref:HEPN domain-containing protein n=2 Tax=Candidatus Kueneniibacteriota TaxID=1752740 RepID=A0A0G0YTT9_9BACT|nr:MAG: hypothetical protein UV02_C0049G0005 [Candidatus Kuenenbacteria bacterium GW2011_GWA2_42_15]OGG98683.1 MAG: hypothetical protein A3E04_01775 [Candidatus Kuenenbacteria bacterium RIFCSPHIGHO2_12_FULL_42_14]
MKNNHQSLGRQNIDELIAYWLATAAHDYQVMLKLFTAKEYSHCLFLGHIVLEKMLKAAVVKETEKQAPYSHGLVFLAGLLKQTKLGQSKLNLLDDVNHFNMRARYPDFKLKFYKLCTRAYTERYLKQIKKLYSQLCQEVKQKK